jgi:VWFA-related protein
MRKMDIASNQPRSFSFFFLLILGFAMVSNIVILAKQEKETDQEFNIQIAVEEVRIDAVVLDGKGRQITDLTANDFELYQDGARREVLSSTYVSDQTKPFVQPAMASQGAQKKKAVSLPPIPAPALARNEIRRTIIFVIDDISMNYEQIRSARMSLLNFVENQMQPGDIIAILRTSYGSSALQMFLSDRKELLARIDAVARWGPDAGRELAADNLSPIFDGQISAIRYCTRALENMPGRKAMILMTSQIVIPDNGFSGGINYRELYLPRMTRLADVALRAGVVIHFMDIRQLEVEPAFRSAQTFSTSTGGQMQIFGSAAKELGLSVYTGERVQLQNPLPKRTGGLLVENHNFSVTGIGEVNEALKGYYLLSYAPPPNTFTDKRQGGYRRIKVVVKRRGAQVHTRDGFFGKYQAEGESTPAANPLKEALYSPFQHHDLNISLSSGYVNDPKEGYLLRSWLHLDANDLQAVDKKAEGQFISLETIALTFDSNGAIQDSNMVKYDFRFEEKNLAWVKEHGLRFSLLLPIKKPGNYYLRVAVRDQTSGKVGSAYEFIEIPDLSNGRLAISDMFVIANDDDASWVRSGVMKDKAQNWLMPSMLRDETRSPALRSYMPGDSFEYMAVVYNANHRAPDLESQFILYKNGEEILRGEPQKMELNGISDLRRIPIRERMFLGKSLQEGDYVLQLLIKDREKNKFVAQSLCFKIASK